MALRKRILLIAVAVAVSVAIILYFYVGSDGNLPSFRLTQVESGPIIRSGNCTLTLTPRYMRGRLSPGSTPKTSSPESAKQMPSLPLHVPM
jgi:hypothetical protein